MDDKVDAIYLSPHLDDAVMSCGARIHRQVRDGLRVLVITVCAGDPSPGPLSPFARELHERWGLSPSAVVEGRRVEDRIALARLGARFEHWPVPDCVYRRSSADHRPLYGTREAIFGSLSVDPAEQALITSLRNRLSARLERIQQESGQLPRIYAPLVVGNHVDHQLTRQVVAGLGEAELPPQLLALYEDYPYAGDAGALATALNRPAGMVYRPLVDPVGEEDIAAQIEAIGDYRSQISTFWKGRGELEREIRDYAGWVAGGYGLADRVYGIALMASGRSRGTVA